MKAIYFDVSCGRRIRTTEEGCRRGFIFTPGQGIPASVSVGDYLSFKARKAQPLQITKISSEPDLQKAFDIRMRVFVKEQRVPRDIELDNDDDRAVHFLATIAGKTIGTARIVMRRGSAKIGRMAVLKSHRRKGVGKKLLKHAVVCAKKLGARKIYLHAQVAVIGFYQRAGFRCVGPVFDEGGIPHRKMILGAEKTL
jgi:predicted GNAT family N-acyltransferase